MPSLRRTVKHLPEPPSFPTSANPAFTGQKERETRPIMPGLTWRQYAMAALPLMAVALGGSTARWSQAVLLLGVGGLLLAEPPRASAGRAVNGVLLGLLALAGMGFLPAAWFAQPAWRAALTDDFGLTLPRTLSPQPWLTAESMVLFLVGVGWFYLMWTAGWNPVQKVRLARFYAMGAAALAAAMALLHTAGVTVPFWINERHFGPFPNRNQTANFLALGALIVLACAHGRWRAGKRAAAVGWMAGLLVMTWALFLSFSRAGVAILFIGVTVYLGLEIRRAARRQANQAVGTRPLSAKLRRFALAGTAVLGLLSAFLLFGGATLERFRPTSTSAPIAAVTTEFRLRVQADAVDLVRASPWCGIGLGNFSGVFAMFRHRSALPARTIHPESDYLWAATELGWPALVLVAVGCVLIVRRLNPAASGSDRRLRLAATLALAAFALHDFVDVSAHRLGTMLPALFLMGLALPSDAALPPARWPALVFRGLGLAFIACGVFWMLNASGVLEPLPGRQGVDRLKERANRQSAQSDYAGAEQSVARAAAWAPLDWMLYFSRAVAGLQTRGNIEEALTDFRRARYLEPFMADVPLSESKVWLGAGQDALAVSALAEACRREPERAEGYIGDLFRAASPQDAHFRDQLSAFARNDPALDLPFLEQLVPPESVQRITERVAADPDLSHLSDPQKTRFFRIWAQRGDVRALADAMARYPDWQKLGWRWWAEALARAGDEKSACGVASRFASAPVLPPKPATSAPPVELLAEASRAPGNPIPALQLYFARKNVENPAAVLSAVRRITAQPNAPRYFQYLDAELSAEAGEWRHSWECWQRYLQTP